MNELTIACSLFLTTGMFIETFDGVVWLIGERKRGIGGMMGSIIHSFFYFLAQIMKIAENEMK